MNSVNTESKDLGVGIYKIVMMAFPKPRVLYVGQSKYLRQRIRQHKELLKTGKHHNPHLQNIFDKHGFSGMVFETICNCNISELDTLEQFYIDELNPECNIVRDIANWNEYITKRKEDQPVLLDCEVIGLELDWKPQKWHKWVYGSGRR